MTNEYRVIKKVGGKDYQLWDDLNWRSVHRKGHCNLITGRTPAELSTAISALHFKLKVLQPGSEPLITDDVFIEGPSGGLYRPLTGTPVRWEKV